MAPAKISDDGNVTITLDEHTKAVAREAAREAVAEHMRTCPIVTEFKEMHADMYGVPGEKGLSPGLVGDNAMLKTWKSSVEKHISRVWAVIVAILGAVATAACKLWLGGIN